MPRIASRLSVHGQGRARGDYVPERPHGGHTLGAFCVEGSGDDEVSVHHMSSREQKDETIVGSKVEMIDSETLVSGTNSSVHLRFGAEEA